MIKQGKNCLMPSLSLKETLHFWTAYALVKLNKLRFDAFSEEELSTLVSELFPVTIPIDIPIGNAQLRCIRGKVEMPPNTTRIHLRILSEIEIRIMGNLIYRAHVSSTLSALPCYDSDLHTVRAIDIQLNALTFVNDDYALLNDTRFLIDKIAPVSNIANILTQPLKVALDVITPGTRSQVLDYLRLFLQGNKQKVLDYHKPQIQEQLMAQLDSMPTTFSLRDHIWRERLFKALGKRVTVHNNQLKFWFAEHEPHP